MRFDASAKMKQGRLRIVGRGVGDLGESQWTLGGDAWGKEGSERLRKRERHMFARPCKVFQGDHWGEEMLKGILSVQGAGNGETHCFSHLP